MKQFFVTGTDTGVGKTLVSAILTSVLQAKYWKPIQTGLQEDIPDPETVSHLTGLTDFFPTTYQLDQPLSPNHAAELSGIQIDLTRCQLPETNQSLIVEGAGGAFVPVNEQQTLLDLMKQLNLPVIIVARGTLGTINHTLLTVTALKQWQIPIHGIVLNGELNPLNIKTIEQWSGVKILFHVPAFAAVNRATLTNWLNAEGKTIHDSLTA